MSLSALKGFGKVMFIVFVRIVITKDPVILAMLASDQYKEVIRSILHRF